MFFLFPPFFWNAAEEHVSERHWHCGGLGIETQCMVSELLNSPVWSISDFLLTVKSHRTGKSKELDIKKKNVLK